MIKALVASHGRCLVWGCAVLLGCGGGGSSDGGSTPINTGAATVQSGNVDVFVGDASLSALMGLSTRVGPYVTINVNSPPSVTATQSGCLRGTAGLALSRDAASNVTGALSYTAFDNCLFFAFGGNANVSGKLVGDTVETINYTFTDLQYTRTDSGAVYHLSGTLSLSWKPSFQGSAGYVMNFNGTVSDALRSELFKLQDFRIDSDMAAGLQQVTLSGRIVHPVHGYVDVSTTNRLTLYVPGTGPWSGTLVLTGKGNAATITYASGSYTKAIS